MTRSRFSTNCRTGCSFGRRGLSDQASARSLVRAAAHGCVVSLRGSGQRMENAFHQGEELLAPGVVG